MWTLYYRHPRLLILTVALIVAAGLGSYLSMPRKEDPTLVQRFGLVLTQFPGAGAGEMESLVTEPLEQVLREVDGVFAVYSVSRFGYSVIEVELAEWIHEVSPIWAQVRDKLEEASRQFPVGTSAPRLDLISTDVDAWSLIAALVWERDGEVPLPVLSRLSEELSTRLRNLPGTRQTSRFGAPREEVRVEVTSDRLAALGLTPDQLADAIAAADARLPAGRVVGGSGDLRLDIAGEFLNLDRIRRAPVRTGPDGEIVLVEHIADVRKERQDPATEIALIDGRQSVAVAARALENTRIEEWADRAREEVETFSADLPEGIEIRILFDQSRYVETRLDGLAWNLALGGLLVILLTGLIMGLRSAVLVGLALPLSCLMVFAGLNLLGVPLHQMSVTGLVIALGLLIDNAIIVVHDLKGRLGSQPAVAALAATGRHLAVPLAASTLTTALAFAPLFLMPGPAGEFVGAIGISVVLALFSSLLISLTIVAALSALLPQGPGTGLARRIDEGFRSRKLADGYSRTLDHFLGRPVLAIALSLAAPLIGFLLASGLPEEFFPAADRSEFQVQLRLAPAASIEQTREAALTAWRVLEQREEIGESFWFVGSAAPKFYYNMVGGQDGDASFAQGVLRMAGGALADPETVLAVQDTLQRELPGVEVLALQFGQGPPVNAPVELHVYGPDLRTLQGIGESLQEVLARRPDVLSARSTLGVSRPFAQFLPNHAAVESSGLDLSALARTVSGFLDGSVGGALQEDTERLPVRVQVVDGERRSTDAVRRFNLPTPGSSGEWIPLSGLGTLDLEIENTSIRHRNGQRANSVQAFLAPGVLPSAVLNDLLRETQGLQAGLPPGYRIEIGGDSGERDEAVTRLLGPAAVLMVLMAATLVLAFNSFRLAGVIAVVAVATVGLGLLALRLFGLPFGFMAIVGIMGLIGVAVNDAIVILSGLREEGCGSNLTRVRDAVMKATPHVLSTTVTTVAGFLPLILDGGRFWTPLAAAVAGGLVGATLLSLVFVPAAWLILQRFVRQQEDSPTATPTGERLPAAQEADLALARATASDMASSRA